jgi:hypothetical protein
MPPDGIRLGSMTSNIRAKSSSRPKSSATVLGEDDVAHGLGDEAVFAPLEILARPPDRCRGAAHVLDVLAPALDGRQRVEAGGVGVVPAEVALVDRLRVVAVRAVVAARVPSSGEAFRRGET